MSKGLIKYLPLKKDRILDFMNKGIYAAKTNQLNDPYEQIGIEEAERYRVVCLTRSRNKRILWAYYASGPGCCVEFVMDKKDDGVINKVIYDKISDFRSIRQQQDPAVSLLHKDKKFYEEREYRAVLDYSKPIDNEFWFKENDIVYYKARVRRIYFAPFSEKQEDYQSVLEKIRKYNQNQKYKKDLIEVKKYKLDEKMYLFRIDNSFVFQE